MSLASPLFAQLAAAALGMAAMPLVPPERGTMLLIPVKGHAADAMNLAVSGGAAVLGQGPLPGSLLIRGERARIGGRAWRGGMVLLAAPTALCGRVA